jgi:hypothetical protein
MQAEFDAGCAERRGRRCFSNNPAGTPVRGAAAVLVPVPPKPVFSFGFVGNSGASGRLAQLAEQLAYIQ